MFRSARQQQAPIAAAIRGLNQPNGPISVAYEEILLFEERWRETYDRHAAMTSKYPQIEPKVALDALVGRTSGDEGTWFAAAKSRNQQGFHRSGRVC